MQNINYELVKRTRKTVKKIIKTSGNKYELMELKKRLHKRNKRLWWFHYQIRPQVVTVTMPQFIRN